MKILFSLFIGLIALNSEASGGLGDLMESLGEKHRLPGVGVAFIKQGRLSLVETTGVKSIEDQKRLSSKDRFHLGSQTKAMTAMLIAKLVEQRRISYESKLIEFFPKIDFHPKNKETTIEMLLLHRSGLPQGIPNFQKIKEELNRAPNIIKAREITVRHLLAYEPEFIPGKKDVYNNSGYMILGHLLEKIYGISFEEIIRRELFNPLNMKTCDFQEKKGDPSGHIIQRGILTAFPGDNLDIWAPAGKARCTLSDWSRFIQHHLNLMKLNRGLLYSTVGSGMNYTRAALFKDKRDWFEEEAFTHTGTNLTNYARVWIFPKSNRAILVATNRGGDESFSGSDEALKETNDALTEIAKYIYISDK